MEDAEHALHPWVAFLVLPVFAFVNAGVSLEGVTVSTLTQSVPLGITAGLVAGKAVGVFGASWLIVKLAGASFPAGATLRQFFAVCLLCGVGFTMSLFIGGLAFEGQDAALRDPAEDRRARRLAAVGAARCGADAGRAAARRDQWSFAGLTSSRSVNAMAIAESRKAMWMAVCHSSTLSV